MDFFDLSAGRFFLGLGGIHTVNRICVLIKGFASVVTILIAIETLIMPVISRSTSTRTPTSVVATSSLGTMGSGRGYK